MVILWALGFFFPNVVLAFDQNEYEVIFERLEAVRFNTSYVANVKTHNFKYNRTHAAVNSTYKFSIAFGNELQMEVQAYKFYSNEYRVFPMRFMYNYCALIGKNEFGMGEALNNCGEFAGTTCPLRKGTYLSCNWMPDVSKYPPHVPSGRFKADVKFYFRSVEVMFTQAFVEIKYPEVPGLAVFRG